MRDVTRCRLGPAIACAIVLSWWTPATAQTPSGVSVFGSVGTTVGDPGYASGSLSFGGGLLIPLRTLMRVSIDAHTFAFGEQRPLSRQTLVGAALAAEGPPGRRLRLLASAGAGLVRYYEPHREGTVPVGYANVGTMLTLRPHVLIRADGIFWAGDDTAAAGVRVGAGWRF